MYIQAGEMENENFTILQHELMRGEMLHRPPYAFLSGERKQNNVSEKIWQNRLTGGREEYNVVIASV